MDLKQLKIFADIADVGSLTKAAVMHGTAQSVLSKQIGFLEEEFRSRLFYRTGRGVVLTEFGQSILPRVKALLIEAEQLKDEVKANAGVPFGLVNVGIVQSTARPLVNKLFQRTRVDYPGIRLRVIEGFSDYINEWLANGRVDVGILNRYGMDKPRTDEKLLIVDLLLVGPVGDELTAKKSVKFAKLTGLPLVLPGLPNGLRMMLDEAARGQGISLSIAIEIDSLVIMKDVVADGGLYTVLPMQAVYQEIQSGRLQATRVVEPSLSRIVVLGTSTQRPLTMATREVVRLIRELATEFVKSGQWQGH